LPIFVAVDLGGSHGWVGLIASAYAIAQFVGSTPVGVLRLELPLALPLSMAFDGDAADRMKHVHYATAACASLALLVATALLSFAAQSVVVLLAVRLAGGLGSSAFDISRKAYIAAEVPPVQRGRVSALLASMQKWAIMIAALLSGVVAQHVATRGIFLVQAALSFLALVCIGSDALCNRAKSAESEVDDAPSERSDGEGRDTSLRAVLRENWRGLLGAGLYCAMLNGIRNTWMVAVPLQAHHIGLSKMGIGGVVAWYRACDATVTGLAAGHLMDRYGLKATAIPSMLLMSLAFGLLALAQSELSLVLVAAVFGLGNGLCGGILNAFAAGLTPRHARTQFLGLWKTVTSVGGICLPPLFGVVSDASNLGLASGVLALCGFATAAWTLLAVAEVGTHSTAPEAEARSVALVANPATPQSQSTAASA
ncbi:unnamed protein product, partial [Effrenium voratum]